MDNMICKCGHKYEDHDPWCPDCGRGGTCVPGCNCEDFIDKDYVPIPFEKLDSITQFVIKRAVDAVLKDLFSESDLMKQLRSKEPVTFKG
jgi:hypothetical protein